ncbi:hypothetical protein H072_3557 [Dactylellina haptotyla CBS 200.50]|uniref:DUF1308 domain-containing protein n=1 Tax=Dactylellina haptotyla (strain CBS 200.50) TaxID=1284197 RepID=S8BSL6_DACHA|nr:hypothetical protein H072_3557 [Dactylellina haptotyla CBS 200.50]
MANIVDCDDLSSDGSDSAAAPPLNPLADELLKRCITLSDEIALLEKKLLQRLPPKQRSKKGNLPIELRHFKNAIQVEQRLLEALSYKTPTDRTLHSLRSSNLKFLESVWSVAKTCSGLQVIFRTVYLFDHPPDDVPKLRGKDKKQLKRKKSPVQVDIIAQNGLEWIKVANLSEKRLNTEFAKARWEAEGFRDGSEDESGDDGDYCHSPTELPPASGPETDKSSLSKMITDFQHDSDAFSLVKSARSMVQAAQQTRVQYLHPEITIVLPNITYDLQESPDPSSPIHALITAILSTGARVQTSNKIIGSSTPPNANGSSNNNNKNSASAPKVDNLGNSIEDVLHHLSRTSDPITLITPHIILDCTMLLALVSDLSHEDVAESPIFHRYILAQVRAEREEPLLPHWLYPCISGRQMSCTFEAYKRFREIVEIVGSEREKKRAEALVAGAPKDWKHPVRKNSVSSAVDHTTQREPTVLSSPVDDKTKRGLLETLQESSKHQVPVDLQLPITVIDGLDAELMAHDPVAAKIGPELSSVNRSSLFAAWELGWTIVTTNGSVVKRLEWLVEENRTKDEDAGPKVHLVAIARSLVGKMKRSAEILKED